MTKVTMVLASGPDMLDGDLNDRIDMQVMLTAHGHLDPSAWETGRETWLTVRQRVGRPTRTGELVKIDDGWALRDVDSEDGPLSSLSATIIRPGEIVTVVRPKGDALIYRIVSVDPD